MNTNVKWIAGQPVVRSYFTQTRSTGHWSSGSHFTMKVEATDPRIQEMRSGVKLSRNPKDLYTVWKEWEFRLNGTQPVRDFTILERGANKFAFSQHKPLWDTVTCMIAHGFTSDTAIDKIYLVYSQAKSVCSICYALAKD